MPGMQVGLALFQAAGRLGLPVGFMPFKGLLLHIAEIEALIAAHPETSVIMDHVRGAGVMWHRACASWHACCVSLALCRARILPQAVCQSMTAHPSPTRATPHGCMGDMQFGFCKSSDLQSEEWKALLALARHPQVRGACGTALKSQHLGCSCEACLRWGTEHAMRTAELMLRPDTF